MRIPDEVHRRRPWRIHALARDFELWDVWRYPLEADADEFGELCRLHDELLDFDAIEGSAARFLFRLRTRLGRLFGWDTDANALPIPGCREHSLRERLGEPAPPPSSGFREVYSAADERCYELSNRTVHALLHLGFVALGDGAHGAELAILVKPRGTSGRLYLALIAPFRRLVVYPALMRTVGRRWAGRAP